MEIRSNVISRIGLGGGLLPEGLQNLLACRQEEDQELGKNAPMD
jgi:hypothetical protein